MFPEKDWLNDPELAEKEVFPKVSNMALQAIVNNMQCSEEVRAAAEKELMRRFQLMMRRGKWMSVRSIVTKTLRVACVSAFELTFVAVDTANGLGHALMGVCNDVVREAKK